jgi:hypothetical protein
MTKPRQTLLNHLRSLRPKPAPASDELKQWWNDKALPPLKAQALSEFHRHDEFHPRLIGFMEGGDMGIIDVSEATGGNWGDAASKDATAFIHKIAALIPSTYASVFCSEAWALRAPSTGQLDRQRDKYPNLGDHPDAYEVLMFQMLHYERKSNVMMQLSTMTEILKVLGKPRTRSMWAGTKLSDEVSTTDPLFGEGKMEGRFVYDGRLDE